MNFRLDVTNMPEIQAAFAEIPPRTLGILTKAMYQAMLPIATDAAKAAPKDRGILYESILAPKRVEIEGGCLSLAVGPGGNASAYGRAQEFGWKKTGSGGGQSSTEGPNMLEALTEWVHRHAGYFELLGSMKRWKMRKAGLQDVGYVKATKDSAVELEHDIALAILRKMFAGTARANQPKHFLTNAWNAHKNEIQPKIEAALSKIKLGGA